jgi:hypothetical protein
LINHNETDAFEKLQPLPQKNIGLGIITSELSYSEIIAKASLIQNMQDFEELEKGRLNEVKKQIPGFGESYKWNRQHDQVITGVTLKHLVRCMKSHSPETNVF